MNSMALLLISSLATMGVAGCAGTPHSAATAPKAEKIDTPAALKGLIVKEGSVFLVKSGECLEWKTTKSNMGLMLTRAWFPLSRPERHRQWRTIEVMSKGLVIKSPHKEEREERDPQTSSWKVANGTVGGGLCSADPSFEEISPGNHYRVGGGDIFLSRRSCEASTKTAERACE